MSEKSPNNTTLSEILAPPITNSDGTNTKTHTVANLFVDGVDVAADTVFGRADAGTSVDVWVHDNGNVTVTADGAGNWMADFSVAAGGQPIYDITDTTRIDVNEFDDDGDATYRRFGPPIQQNRGVAVTPIDNHIWVANRGVDTVTRLDNDVTVVKVIDTGEEPTGVAVDAAGKVWATNMGSDNTVRIDPNAGPDGLGAVDLTVDLGPGGRSLQLQRHDRSSRGRVHFAARLLDGSSGQWKPWL